MQKKIRIDIEDFGSINKANIDIGKINIIGGSNSTGKSFSSKLTYCFLVAISNQGTNIANNGIKNLFINFKNYWTNSLRTNSLISIDYEPEELKNSLNTMIKEWNPNEISYEYFNNFYIKFKNILTNYNLLNNERCVEDLENIKNIIKKYENNPFIYISDVINFLLKTEFKESQLNSFQNSKITFTGENTIDNFKYFLSFNSKGLQIESPIKINDKWINFSKIFYLNSLTILDGLNILPLNNTIRSPDYHFIANQKYIIDSKNSNEIYLSTYDKKINDFSDKITEILGGTFRFDRNKGIIFETNENGDSEIYELSNIASGYKQIGIIQILLNNKQITEDSVIIFDEPEVNLHPKLQIDLANILISMVKELNIILYINSHNPMFIEALITYSKYYNFIKDTNVYLTEKVKNNKFNFRKINPERLGPVYEDLGSPYDKIDLIESKILKNKN